MKNIKLKSLLKEDEMKAKSMWNRLDADSREDILLRFVKNPDAAGKMADLNWDRLPNQIAGNKDFQDAITDQKGLRETNIKMVDLVKEVMAYGEEEAIKMIWDDPGGKIESKLKGINGYESIALGGPWDGAFGKTYPPAGISIYFKNKKAAIYGAAVLSNLVPGPEYEKMIKVGNGYAAIELEA